MDKLYRLVAGKVKRAVLLREKAYEQDVELVRQTVELDEGVLRGEVRVGIGEAPDSPWYEAKPLYWVLVEWTYQIAEFAYLSSAFDALNAKMDRVPIIGPDTADAIALWLEVGDDPAMPEDLRAMLEHEPEPEIEPEPCPLCGEGDGVHAGNCGDNPEPSEEVAGDA